MTLKDECHIACLKEDCEARCLTNLELISNSSTLSKTGRRTIGRYLEGLDDLPEFLKTGTAEEDFRTGTQEQVRYLLYSLERTRASLGAYLYIYIIVNL